MKSLLHEAIDNNILGKVRTGYCLNKIKSSVQDTLKVTRCYILLKKTGDYTSWKIVLDTIKNNVISKCLFRTHPFIFKWPWYNLATNQRGPHWAFKNTLLRTCVLYEHCRHNDRGSSRFMPFFFKVSHHTNYQFPYIPY